MLNLWRRFRRPRHKKVQGLLSAYLDEEVSPRERALVEAHLKECPQCQRELAGLRTTVGILRQMPPLRLPRSFTLAEAPVQRPASRLATSDRAWIYLRGATALAAMLLALVFTGELHQRRSLPAAAPATLRAPVVMKPAELPTEAATTPVPETREAVFAGIEVTPTREVEEVAELVEKAVEQEVTIEREVEKVVEREVATEWEAEEAAEPEVAEEALAQKAPPSPRAEMRPEVQATTAATPVRERDALLASPPVEEKGARPVPASPPTEKREPSPVLVSPPAEEKEASPVLALQETPPPAPVLLGERKGPSNLRWIEGGLLGAFAFLAAATFALARKRRSLHL